MAGGHGRLAWLSVRDPPAGPVRRGSSAGENAMGGRHESPKPGTDVFVAVDILALAVLLAAVITLSLLGD
jgi:hypothetical protein